MNNHAGSSLGGLQGLCFNILMFDKVVLRGGLSRIPETIQLGPYSKDL